MEDMWGKMEIGVVKVKSHMLPVRGLGSREFSKFIIYCTSVCHINKNVSCI